MTLKLGMRHWLLEYYQVCSNDDHGFTLTYFTAGSNLVYIIGVLKYYRTCPNDDTELILTVFMTWSNLFPNASVWVKAYTVYMELCISKLVPIQHILCTQVSDTEPLVL